MSAGSQTGFFISFEGSEGCGKSTQIRKLTEALDRAGYEALLVREPGGTAIGEEIRRLLKTPPGTESMRDEAELLLFAASRAQLVREVILPALAAGQVVISDRFLDSTTVYQGVARRIPAETVSQINHFAAGARLPDVTFLLDMDARTALARAHARRTPESSPDRLEEEPEIFYETVRRGYLRQAAIDADRFRVIDAAQSEAIIHQAILAELHSHAFFQRIRS